MPDQVSPYPPAYGGQGPQPAQPDPRRFNWGNLVSAAASGIGNGSWNPGAALSYASNPNVRAETANQHGIVQGQQVGELAHQQALMNYFRQNQGDPAVMLPENVQAAANAHRAGWEAAKAHSEANLAESTAGRTAYSNTEDVAAHERYAAEHGESAPFTSLQQARTGGEAEIGSKVSAARQARVAAGSAERVSGETGGYDPQYAQFLQQQELAKGQLIGNVDGGPTLQAQELAMQKGELPWKHLAEIAQPFGWAMMGQPDFAKSLITGAASQVPGLNIKSGYEGQPQFPNADHALEQEYARNKAAPSTNNWSQVAAPSAPTAVGSGPGTNAPVRQVQQPQTPALQPPGQESPAWNHGDTGHALQQLMEYLLGNTPQQKQWQQHLTDQHAAQLDPQKARQMIQALRQQGAR